MQADVRGVMNGLFHFFGLLGLTIYTSIAGHLFDNIGPATPFTFVGGVDIFVALLFLPLAFCGYLSE